MQIIISQEDQKELRLLQEDLIQFLIQLKSGLINFSFYLLKMAKEYFMSYSEYSVENIRKEGLSSILYKRALRFFGLEFKEEQGKVKKSRLSSKVTKKQIFKRVLKLVLYPVYFLILLLLKLFKRKSEKKHKNIYRT